VFTFHPHPDKRHRLQVLRQDQVRLGNKMRLMSLDIHQPFQLLQLLYEVLKRTARRHVDVDRMGRISGKIFEFHAEGIHHHGQLREALQKARLGLFEGMAMQHRQRGLQLEGRLHTVPFVEACP
jgi:hypothetical protein